MKKTQITAIIVILALCLGLLTACGQSGTSAPAATEAPAAPAAPAATAAPAAPAAPATTESPTATGPDYGPYSADNPLVLKIATHAYGGDTNIMCVTSDRLAEVLAENSGGAVKLEVYNEAILTKNDQETIDSILVGAIDMGVSNTAIYCRYVDDYSVLDLCYLFEDIDHVRRFMDSDISAKLMARMEEEDTGITILSFNYLGSKNVATSYPIRSLADMKGLNLKCSTGEYYLKGFTAFGAAPQSISSSEVMASLSQGIIDGVEQSSAIIYSGNYLEFVPYVTHTGHIIQMFSVNINTNVYRGLTPDLQAVIKDSAMQVSAELFDPAEQKQVEAEEAMSAQGIEFIDIDKTEWMEAMEPVYAEFTSRFGSELVDGIKALAK